MATWLTPNVLVALPELPALSVTRATAVTVVLPAGTTSVLVPSLPNDEAPGDSATATARTTTAANEIRLTRIECNSDVADDEKRMDVLGLTDGTWLLAGLVLALYVLVIWMLLEILFRADFSGAMKIGWIIVALLFAPVAVPIWFLWVRRKDYSSA